MGSEGPLLPFVICSTGATAREARAIITAINNVCPAFDLLGYVAQQDSGITGTYIDGLPVLCEDSSLDDFSAAFPSLGVVIPVADPVTKRKMHEAICHNARLVFPNLVHPQAVLLDRELLQMSYGCIIEAGVVISVGVSLGPFAFLNYNCTIGHDAKIGPYCTINPQAAVSGGVTLEEQVLVGAGCMIRQNLRVGSGSKLGLGSFIVKDVSPGSVMICEPAHPINGAKS